jgi:hypothetical protein
VIKILFRTILFRRGCCYGSRVPRYAGALPCSTIGCKECFIWQQDGAPPHCHRDVTRYLNQTFPRRWIGRCGSSLATQITRSDTHGFSVCGVVKDNVYILFMPVDLQELRERIVNAIALIDVTFLNKLWDELEYRLDVCRITRGSHIKHL